MLQRLVLPCLQCVMRIGGTSGTIAHEHVLLASVSCGWLSTVTLRPCGSNRNPNHMVQCPANSEQTTRQRRATDAPQATSTAPTHFGPQALYRHSTHKPQARRKPQAHYRHTTGVLDLQNIFFGTSCVLGARVRSHPHPETICFSILVLFFEASWPPGRLRTWCSSVSHMSLRGC